MDVLRENNDPRKQVTSGYDQINLLQKFTYKPNATWNYDLGLYYSETSEFSRYDSLDSDPMMRAMACVQLSGSIWPAKVVYGQRPSSHQAGEEQIL